MVYEFYLNRKITQKSYIFHILQNNVSQQIVCRNRYENPAVFQYTMLRFANVKHCHSSAECFLLWFKKNLATFYKSAIFVNT